MTGAELIEKLDNHLINEKSRNSKKKVKKKLSNDIYTSAKVLNRYVNVSIDTLESYLEGSELVKFSYVNAGIKIYKIL